MTKRITNKIAAMRTWHKSCQLLDSVDITRGGRGFTPEIELFSGNFASPTKWRLQCQAYKSY